MLATVVALLVLSACGDDSGSGSGSGGASGSSGSAPVTLTLTENGCDPVSFSAPAGQVEFAVGHGIA